MEAKTRHYAVRELAGPVAPPEIPPVDPPPEVPSPADLGYLYLADARTLGPDTFAVDILGGTNTQVDGYSLFIGHDATLQPVSFSPGKFVTDYVAPNDPFVVFQPHDKDSPDAVPGPYVGIQCGLWSIADVANTPVTIPQGTVLGTLVFRWTVPGSYLLDNASMKYGRLPLPALYTRLTARYVPAEIQSLLVGVPIS